MRKKGVLGNRIESKERRESQKTFISTWKTLPSALELQEFPGSACTDFYLGQDLQSRIQIICPELETGTLKALKEKGWHCVHSLQSDRPHFKKQWHHNTI